MIIIPRSGLKLSISKERVFAIGGANGRWTSEKVHYVEEYDYKGNEWKIMEVKPLNRAWDSAMAAVPDSYFKHWADETCKH